MPDEDLDLAGYFYLSYSLPILKSAIYTACMIMRYGAS